jgi:tryptophan-rich sensory protein
VFGAAWTLIMVCFSFYMSVSMLKSKNKKQLISLFSIQWILNISWNPIFFYFHNANLGLAVIVLLTALVGYIFIFNRKKIKYFSFLILPYFLWLVIASSLNGYIVIFN